MRSTKMSSRGRWSAVAAIAAATGLVLTACAPPGAQQEENQDTGVMKVGYISPITGNFAIAGQEMVDGWNLYWEINGTEVNGVEVETIIEDDAGNPETSLTKAKKLVEADGVDVVVGPLLANTALATAAYTSTVQ